MDFGLSEADLGIQAAARSFAEEHIAPGARAADEEGTFDSSRVPLLGAAGLLGGPIDPKWGAPVGLIASGSWL